MFLLHPFTIFLTLSLSFLLPTTSSTTTIGLTYSSSSSTPDPTAPDRITSAIHNLSLRSLRLDDPDPAIIRTLLYTNVSLFLTIPNYLVTPIASNRSIAIAWIYAHVVPFYPRVKITTISVGNAFLDVYPQSINNLLPAISNVHLSLRDLGIRKISVSTSFSFVSTISTPFPPSAATFQEPPTINLFGPLLQFLRDTNSSFLINLYPYNLYRLRSEITLGIALFQEYPFNFRDDITTGVRYRNLFDIMVDAVVSAMAIAGYENIPVVVTETGWPSSSTAGNEMDANLGYAEIYLKGLVKHVTSRIGTPLLRDGLKEVYVYEMFDKVGAGREWGILFPNGTAKYDVDFSSSSASGSVNFAITIFLVFILTVFHHQ